jgi:hypothetical protein
MFEGELEAALSRPRYARSVKPLSGDGEGAVCVSGHRHGHRSRSLLGSEKSHHMLVALSLKARRRRVSAGALFCAATAPLPP